MRRDANSGRVLLLRLAVGAGVAVVLVVLGRLVGLGIAPVPALLLGLLIGTATWLWSGFEEPPSSPGWQQPQPPAEASRFSADVRTRRLASMLAHAQPGQGFDAGSLTRALADLTASRLVHTRDLPAEDTLAHADGHLSPALLAYLRTADGERPAILNRRTLHAHLKEIDEL